MRTLAAVDPSLFFVVLGILPSLTVADEPFVAVPFVNEVLAAVVIALERLLLQHLPLPFDFLGRVERQANERVLAIERRIKSDVMNAVVI